MLITATHWDGVSDSLLSWEAVLCDGEGKVTATWFQRKKTAWTGTFRLEKEPSEEQFRRFCRLERRYELPLDDIGSQRLRIETATIAHECHVDCILAMVCDHPELKAFADIWRLIEEPVEKLLPPEALKMD